MENLVKTKLNCTIQVYSGCEKNEMKAQFPYVKLFF